MINPLVIPYLIGAVIALLTATTVVHIVVTIDDHLVKRKKVQEIDAEGAAFRHRVEEHHKEMMLSLGMNPGYTSYAHCSPSRHGVQTQMLRSNLGMGVMMPPPPTTTENEARKAMLDQMSENLQTQIENRVRGHMTAIPAPALFMQETIDKLKEISDDRETDDQSD